jgi:hypothetical protein
MKPTPVLMLALRPGRHFAYPGDADSDLGLMSPRIGEVYSVVNVVDP